MADSPSDAILGGLQLLFPAKMVVHQLGVLLGIADNRAVLPDEGYAGLRQPADSLRLGGIIGQRLGTVHVPELHGPGKEINLPGHIVLQRPDMGILEQIRHCKTRPDNGNTDQNH
ncbi:hypothetical protein D3C71_1246700 [compost metagenome]